MLVYQWIGYWKSLWNEWDTMATIIGNSWYIMGGNGMLTGSIWGC
jgi:hypothetical protein